MMRGLEKFLGLINTFIYHELGVLNLINTLIRVSNNGVSAIIDNYGRILEVYSTEY